MGRKKVEYRRSPAGVKARGRGAWLTAHCRKAAEARVAYLCVRGRISGVGGE